IRGASSSRMRSCHGSSRASHRGAATRRFSMVCMEPIAIFIASILRRTSRRRSAPPTHGCTATNGRGDRFSTPPEAVRSRPIARVRSTRGKSGAWCPFLFLLIVSCAQTPKPAAQNPSPMVDFTRAHERLAKKTIEGDQFTIVWSPGFSRDRPAESGAPSRTAEVLITPRAAAEGVGDLLIHFHGASWIPFQAAISTERPRVVGVVNIGQGGGIYDRTFSDPAAFDALVAGVRQRIAVRRIFLSGFSA